MEVGEDISPRKAMERRLLESERLATMGQLAGFIAHELNTPLTSISLLTSAASKRVKDSVALQKLHKIDEERRRAADIIRELLSLSKSRQIAAVETDLRSVVGSAVEQMRRKPKAGLTLDVDLGDQPASVVVDPLQIQEVVSNLLENALDATTKGSIRIRIEGRPKAFAIIVADTGTGMSPDVLAHLFEPFYTTKSHGDGIGLGLLLAKHIVTGHGGTLEVTSKTGQGSTFTVLLPRRDGP
jgi:signal transduction histidine kinase